MLICCPAAPAPGIPFDNSHLPGPAKLNPATEKIISVEVNNQRLILRRFNCFCVVELAYLDLTFLFTLNLIVGCSFGVDTKMLSLITERGFIGGLYGSWR
jgi:hypothetical protein